MPALVHLTRLGYRYFGKVSEDMSGIEYDPDTNILIKVFFKKFDELNPEHTGKGQEILRVIRIELDNDDLGRSFYRVYWKQWKKIKTKYRMLKELGMEHWKAKELACSRKGYWRMAQVLNQIFSNKIIAKLGANCTVSSFS